MKRTTLVLALVLIASPVLAAGSAATSPVHRQGDNGPLDKALALALQESAVIRAEKARLAAVADQHAWTSRVRLSYAQQATANSNGVIEAGGLNARFEVIIPLWDTSEELAAAKQRQALASAEQSLTGGFLSAVQALDAAYIKQLNALETTHLVHDRIKYREQQAQQGLIASADLWTDAEQGKQAEQAARAAIAATRTLLATTARHYGGARWPTLRRLLVAHLKSLRP